jgi:predicted dehydrogenase
MTGKVCRWGILGTAGIARKNWKAIRLSGNGVVAAVASRSASSANRFIDECSAEVPFCERPLAIDSYEALLERADIDAVYIPLPTALRHEWVKRAAEAGKHIVGEKPAALDAGQVADMLEACRKHKVQYMDGVMFMHSQRLPMIREVLERGEAVGELKRLAAQFSFCGNEEFRTTNIRTHSDLEPHGCLGDLGWYCIRFFLWAMRGEMPQKVHGRILSTLQGTTSPQSVPGEFSAELVFPSGVSASFYCSFVTENQQWVHASGSRGYLRVNDFVLPFRGAEVDAVSGQDIFDVQNCSFHMENHLHRHSVREYDAGHSTAQEVRLFRSFSEIVVSGQLSDVWPDWTLKTQQVLDACFQSAASNGATITLDSM